MKSKSLGLLVVGWFLMAPPIQDSNMPLCDWTQIAAYDSATDCEGDKFRIYSEWSNDTTSEGTRRAKRILASVCIPTNDPRLIRQPR